jgi:hypothetical protein
MNLLFSFLSVTAIVPALFQLTLRSCGRCETEILQTGPINELVDSLRDSQQSLALARYCFGIKCVEI